MGSYRDTGIIDSNTTAEAMAQWKYLDLRAQEKRRENALSEFFNTKSITQPAQALVREGIQNSLDAYDSSGRPVKVRIFHSGQDEKRSVAPLTRDIAPFTENLASHLKASGFAPPKPSDPVHFLAFEDFNTTGLYGDPSVWDNPDEENPYFSYVRAEGWSQKGGDSAGRWGIGKYAFPRVSKFKMHYGLTVPHTNNKPLLFGQNILTHHQLDGTWYKPDGSFGKFTDKTHDTLCLPVTDDHSVDKDLIEEFKDLFQLKRTTEPGLSVVVPYIDYKSHDIDFDDLKVAVVTAYHLPILQEKLVVSLEESGKPSITIDKNLLFNTSKLDNLDLPEDVLAEIQIVKKHLYSPKQSCDIELTISKNQNSGGPSWDDFNIVSVNEPGSARAKPGRNKTTLEEDARQLFSTEDFISVDVSTHTFPKDESSKVKEKQCRFTVLFSREDKGQYRPRYFRNVLKITDTGGDRVPNFRTIVMIPKDPLSKFLGDAENPAHTKWSNRTDTIIGKYKYAREIINLVQQAPSNILRKIRNSDNERDKLLLADIFRDPTPSQSPDNSSPGSGETTEPEVVIDSTPKAYKIRKTSNTGFQLEATGDKKPPPKINLALAYDISAGNPIKNHSKFDFDLCTGNELEIDFAGCTVEYLSPNELALSITSEYFIFEVTGFDEHRDLFIKAQP